MSNRKPKAKPNELPPAMALKMKGRTPVENVCEIPIDRIIPDPDQPRKFFDDLPGLAESLKKHGQLQAITVRYSNLHNAYVIVAGERRHRAAGYAGLNTLKCVVIGEDRARIDDAEIVELQLVENIQRQEMLPMETAAGIRRLMNLKGITASQAAERLGMHKGQVSKLVALLDLPERIRNLVDNKQLAPSTAYEISKLPDSVEQLKLAEQAVAKSMSRDAVAEFVLSQKLGADVGVPLDKCTIAKSAPVENRPRHEPVDLGEFKITVKGPAIEIEANQVFIQCTMLEKLPSPSVEALAQLLHSIGDRVAQESKKLIYAFGEEKR